MARLFIMILIALISCKNQNFQKYKSIVQKADKFEIYYKSVNKTVRIPEQDIDKFKDILTRNVKPELQRKFINKVRVDFYKNGNRIAFLMINNGNPSPFVNFNSDNLNFGFRLTYGIGMTIDNLYAQNSH